jgi:hypothetical protein
MLGSLRRSRPKDSISAQTLQDRACDRLRIDPIFAPLDPVFDVCELLLSHVFH